MGAEEFHLEGAETADSGDVNAQEGRGAGTRKLKRWIESEGEGMEVLAETGVESHAGLKAKA